MSFEMQGLYREFINLLAQKRREILAAGEPTEAISSSVWDLGKGGDPRVDVDRSYAFVSHDCEKTLQNSRRNELLQIQLAIHRMKEGVFGTCSTCGREIPVDELRRLPEAIHCRQCS